MTTTRQNTRETLNRVPDGYTTADGYFIERCPGNQWNVVTHQDGSYPEDYVTEGARSALQAVTQDRSEA